MPDSLYTLNPPDILSGFVITPAMVEDPEDIADQQRWAADRLRNDLNTPIDDWFHTTEEFNASMKNAERVFEMHWASKIDPVKAHQEGRGYKYIEELRKEKDRQWTIITTHLKNRSPAEYYRRKNEEDAKRKQREWFSDRGLKVPEALLPTADLPIVQEDRDAANLAFKRNEISYEEWARRTGRHEEAEIAKKQREGLMYGRSASAPQPGSEEWKIRQEERIGQPTLTRKRANLNKWLGEPVGELTMGLYRSLAGLVKGVGGIVEAAGHTYEVPGEIFNKLTDRPEKRDQFGFPLNVDPNALVSLGRYITEAGAANEEWMSKGERLQLMSTTDKMQSPLYWGVAITEFAGPAAIAYYTGNTHALTATFASMAYADAMIAGGREGMSPEEAHPRALMEATGVALIFTSFGAIGFAKYLAPGRPGAPVVMEAIKRSVKEQLHRAALKGTMEAGHVGADFTANTMLGALLYLNTAANRNQGIHASEMFESGIELGMFGVAMRQLHNIAKVSGKLGGMKFFDNAVPPATLEEARAWAKKQGRRLSGAEEVFYKYLNVDPRTELSARDRADIMNQFISDLASKDAVEWFKSVPGIEELDRRGVNPEDILNRKGFEKITGVANTSLELDRKPIAAMLERYKAEHPAVAPAVAETPGPPPSGPPPGAERAAGLPARPPEVAGPARQRERTGQEAGERAYAKAIGGGKSEDAAFKAEREAWEAAREAWGVETLDAAQAAWEAAERAGREAAEGKEGLARDAALTEAREKAWGAWEAARKAATLDAARAAWEAAEGVAWEAAEGKEGLARDAALTEARGEAWEAARAALEAAEREAAGPARPAPEAPLPPRPAPPEALPAAKAAEVAPVVQPVAVLPKTAWFTPVTPGGEALAQIQGAGLPAGKFYALDRPFESTVHDPANAKQVSVPDVKNVFDPDGLLNPANREGHGKIFHDLTREINDIITERKRTGRSTNMQDIRTAMTELLRDRGFDSYVRGIDGDPGNRELIVFDQPEGKAPVVQPPHVAPARAAEVAPTVKPPAAAPEAVAKAKEPWEMTKKEWVGEGTVAETVMGTVLNSPRFFGPDAIEQAEQWAKSRGFPKNSFTIQTSRRKSTGELIFAMVNSTPGWHEYIVATALREGKPVPPAVLAEYPELAAKAPPDVTTGAPKIIDLPGAEPKAAYGTMPAGPLPGKVAGNIPFIVQPPETKLGRVLIGNLQRDARRPEKRIGLRSIVDYVNDLAYSIMQVGKSQTILKYPAKFEYGPQLIRTRSGSWTLNFHEAGHALANWLERKYGASLGPFKANLEAIADMEGSYASAKTAREGAAELIRRYITDYNSLPRNLVTAFETTLGETAPEMLRGLRDASRAYAFHTSRPLMEQLTTLRTDTRAPYGRMEGLANFFWNVWRMTAGNDNINNRLRNKIFKGIAGRNYLERVFGSNVKLAREFEALIEDTPADYQRAYESMLHVPAEVQRALYGAKEGPSGLRVRSTGQGFDNLLPEDLAILKKAFPDELPIIGPTKHGNWIYLGGRALADIKRDVRAERWDLFQTYGQYRAALERFNKSGQAYPGAVEYGPEQIRAALAETVRSNPDFPKLFKDVQAYSKKLVLVPVLSGEISATEAARIVGRWEDHWPLPRQLEERYTRRTGAGPEPSSGIHRAFGSYLPFKSLEEALEIRTRMAYDAYYANRLRLSYKHLAERLDAFRDAPEELKIDINRLLMPLELDPKKVATLTVEELAGEIAELMNRKAATKLGIKVEEMPKDQLVRPEDIALDLPGGKPIFRGKRPNLINVIGAFENGKRTYYQVGDPMLYKIFGMMKSPNQYVGYVHKMLIDVGLPWKRLLTQNLVFAARNALARDPTTAMFMGKEKESLLPYFYIATGIIGRLKGKRVGASETETLSRALDATSGDAHRTMSDSFLSMLSEGLTVPNYREMTIGDKIIKLPGQISAAVSKPLEILNWITGGRYLSAQGEGLAREGAYLDALRRGKSEEFAQFAYDEITGAFVRRQPDPTVAGFVRAAGFLNPAIQILSGQAKRITDPDPRVQAKYIGLKLPYIAGVYGVASALNHLAIAAMYSDEDREIIYDEMRERSANDKMGTMAILGKVRLPFDNGVIGGIASAGWNIVDDWILEEPVLAKEKALALLNRSRDIPGLTDILQPHIKTGLELYINHSFFTDKDIVDPWLRAQFPYDPALQVYPETPELYRAIGRGLNVSPLKVRYAVQTILTRTVDQTITAIDALRRDKPLEPADYPVIGQLIHREPRGPRSKSFQKMKDLDIQYQSAAARLKAALKENEDAPDEIIKPLLKQRDNLAAAHRAMKIIDAYWKKIKAERGSPKPDWEKIRTWERRMTAIARARLAEITEPPREEPVETPVSKPPEE